MFKPLTPLSGLPINMLSWTRVATKYGREKRNQPSKSLSGVRLYHISSPCQGTTTVTKSLQNQRRSTFRDTSVEMGGHYLSSLRQATADSVNEAANVPFHTRWPLRCFLNLAGLFCTRDYFPLTADPLTAPIHLLTKGCAFCKDPTIIPHQQVIQCYTLNPRLQFRAQCSVWTWVVRRSISTSHGWGTLICHVLSTVMFCPQWWGHGVWTYPFETVNQNKSSLSLKLNFSCILSQWQREASKLRRCSGARVVSFQESSPVFLPIWCLQPNIVPLCVRQSWLSHK